MRRLFHCVAPTQIGLAVAIATSHSLLLPTLTHAESLGSFPAEATARNEANGLPIRWKIEMLTLDANEGCAIGDINGDGKNDVVAGRNWYAAPDFKPRPLRNIEDWNGYVESNGDFLLDVNGDKLVDVVAGSFLPSQIHWYENPGPEGWRLGQTWKKRMLVDTEASQNEAQLMEDLDNDGKPEWVVNSWEKKNPTTVWRFHQRSATPDNPSLFQVEKAVVGKEGNQHGLGVGDINNDGKKDVLIGSGWFEQPATEPWTQAWKYHPDWNIQGSIPLIVEDIDKDGKNDLLVGAGHDYGLYLWKQKSAEPGKPLAFDEIVIDKKFSQPHALALVDLNGDGTRELVSGKRYYAHNGGDPGGKDMPEINAYQWNGKEFIRSNIEQGHVGVGLQIATGDLNGDGRNDIAVAGKSGTYILLNLPPQ